MDDNENGKGRRMADSTVQEDDGDLKAVADDNKLDVWSDTMEQLSAHHTN
jgi:hypothetical protein